MARIWYTLFQKVGIYVLDIIYFVLVFISEIDQMSTKKKKTTFNSI